jgi:hypothetical protein
MFKILVLLALSNLSDEQTEYQIPDSLSIMKFSGSNGTTTFRCPDELADLTAQPAIFGSQRCQPAFPFLAHAPSHPIEQKSLSCGQVSFRHRQTPSRGGGDS